jgi:DNA-binding NtrC family response regulator
MHSDIECAIRSDANVLIAGGDASARTALAKLIHRRSRRRRSSLVVLGGTGSADQPAADPDQRARVLKKPGRTLFIEELAALDGRTQDELLHLLDTGAGYWKDGAITRKTRIISGTGHDVLKRLASKPFNTRLFYRLNIIHITLADPSRLSDPSSVH